MEKELLGGLEQLILDYITQAVEKNEFVVKLDGKTIGEDGYFDGCVVIGGVVFRCAFNKKGYICWFTEWDYFIREVNADKKFFDVAMKMIKENEAEYRKERIKELQKEINKLKKFK